MSVEEDSDSCSSVIEVSDFEDDDDGASVVTSKIHSDTEDSSGFISEEEPEDWNHNTLTDKTRMGMSINSCVLPGMCALCENLEGVDVDDLEERCQTPSAEPWCKCGECRVVSYHMKKYDRICCHELSGVVGFIQSEFDSAPASHRCITLHPQFKAQVLEYGALYQQHHKYLDKHKWKHGQDEQSRATSSCCAFVLWVWDRLGYGDRIMPPACVVARIREHHMKNAPFWYYRNFLPGKLQCEYGRHCVAAAKDTVNIK